MDAATSNVALRSPRTLPEATHDALLCEVTARVSGWWPDARGCALSSVVGVSLLASVVDKNLGFHDGGAMAMAQSMASERIARVADVHTCGYDAAALAVRRSVCVSARALDGRLRVRPTTSAPRVRRRRQTTSGRRVRPARTTARQRYDRCQHRSADSYNNPINNTDPSGMRTCDNGFNISTGAGLDYDTATSYFRERPIRWIKMSEQARWDSAESRLATCTKYLYEAPWCKDALTCLPCTTESGIINSGDSTWVTKLCHEDQGAMAPSTGESWCREYNDPGVMHISPGYPLQCADQQGPRADLSSNPVCRTASRVSTAAAVRSVLVDGELTPAGEAFVLSAGQAGLNIPGPVRLTADAISGLIVGVCGLDRGVDKTPGGSGLQPWMCPEGLPKQDPHQVAC